MSAFLTHGGRLAAARARFGGEAGDWIDLSTGINPMPWPGAEDIRPDWSALPDPEALAELEGIAAKLFGASRSLCAAVPGSEAGLRALGQLLGRANGLPLARGPLTYGTYARAFDVAPVGHAGPSVRVLTNPNNPDGHLVERAAVLALLAEQEAQGGWLIVDEAFVDCHEGASVADMVEEGRRLIVTRSFGKFFGLAGVRLGFVLAPGHVLAPLRRLLGDWPICAAALAFGTCAYRDRAWMAQTREALFHKARALDSVLAGHGLSAQGASPLFRLVRTGRAQALFEHLACHHILTRPLAGHPDLLRFGLPRDEAACGRLDTVLGAGAPHG